MNINSEKVDKQCCAVCKSAANLKSCAQCKSTSYCSKQHQKQDWGHHKTQCKELHIANALRTTSTEAPSSLDSSDPDVPEPFDERPFKRSTFEQLKPVKFTQGYGPVATLVASKLQEQGFCVIDNLLDANLCNGIFEEVSGIYEKDKMKTGLLAGGKTSGVDSQKVENRNIRSDKILWINGTEDDYPCIRQYLTESIDIIMQNLNRHFQNIYIEDRTKLMAACYPGNGSAYSRHVDNPAMDGRLVTCLLYLNKDWNAQRDGGFLRIFPQSMSDDYVDVEPCMNRMVLFWSDRRSPHEVHPAFRDRFAVTVWYFDKSERQEALHNNIQIELANVRGQIAVMEVRKTEAQKKMLQQQIKQKAEAAVKSLTEEELQNWEKMLENHPNPKGLLNQLRIAAPIQDVLLVLLAKRKQQRGMTTEDELD